MITPSSLVPAYRGQWGHRRVLGDYFFLFREHVCYAHPDIPVSMIV